jgi:hypothetical protein
MVLDARGDGDYDDNDILHFFDIHECISNSRDSSHHHSLFILYRW